MIRRCVICIALLLPAWSLAHAESPVVPKELEQILQAAARKRLAERPEWLALLQFRPKVFGFDSESQADDDSFFFSTAGKTHPQAELEATLAAFALGDSNPIHPQCRFPARFQWLRQQGSPFSDIPTVPCPELDQWLHDLNTESVTLVFASSYLNSPSSMFGHTFLRLDPPDLDRKNPILANTISYAADAGAHDSELAFAYRGIFGGYPGITTVEPYYDKVRLYSKLENRDLWEYRLNLSAAEVQQLLRHAWEIKDKRFDYFFFDENCAYRILTLIDVARPGTDLVSQLATLRAIPSDTVRVVVDNSLVESVHYRPSQATLLHNQIAQLTPVERELAARVFEEKRSLDSGELTSMTADRQAAVFETAYEFTRYRTLSDQLPRETTADLSYALLMQRSRVDTVSGLTPPIAPPVRDDEGHATGRVSIQAGRFAERDFLQLDLRPAYHDLQDPAPGYRNGSQLQFLNAALRYHIDDDELQLEALNLVEILSLSPRDRFFQPLSWGAGFGADRQLLADGGRPLAPYVSGKVGYSYELASSLLYGMATGDLRVSSHLADGYQLAPGLALGWSRQTETSAWHLKAASRYFPGQEDKPLHSVGAAFDLHWRKDISLTFELEREKSGNLYATTLRGGFRVYF